MNTVKSLQELCLIDDFLFAEVLQDKEAARYLLQIVLEKKISYITESKTQEEIKTSPLYHGIRLDVYIEDDLKTVYNVEVQVRNRGDIPKRSRYYQSLIDYKRMPPGEIDYNLLPASYIIFICDFDLYGQGRYKYEFEYRCLQDLSLPYGDQAVKMVLNTKGTNDDEVNPALIRLLHYMADTTDETADEMSDETIEYLQKLVYAVKHSEEKEAAYMLLLEKMMHERQEGWLAGKMEGKLEGELEGRRDTARRMLRRGRPLEEIVEDTGLTEDEVRELQNETMVCEEKGSYGE